MFETLKEISRLSLNAIRTRITEHKKGGVAGVERQLLPMPVKPATASAKAAASASAPATTAAAASDAAAAAAIGTDPALMDPLQVEFAEEDTDKLKLRAVKIHGKLDIGQELDKLRAITSAKAKGLGGAQGSRGRPPVQRAGAGPRHAPGGLAQGGAGGARARCAA